MWSIGMLMEGRSVNSHEGCYEVSVMLSFIGRTGKIPSTGYENLDVWHKELNSFMPSFMFMYCERGEAHMQLYTYELNQYK